MNADRTRILKCLLILALLAVAPLQTVAQPAGGDYMILKSTWDGGGGTSSGGQYSITGTIGQPDASASVLNGPPYRLAGGFWATILEVLFADGFESSPP